VKGFSSKSFPISIIALGITAKQNIGELRMDGVVIWNSPGWVSGPPLAFWLVLL